MSSNPLRLDYLLRKYLNNSCTQEELNEFWQLAAELSDNDIISYGLYDLWQDEGPVLDRENEEDVSNKLFEKIHELKKENLLDVRRRRKIRRLLTTVSAAIFIGLAITLIWPSVSNNPGKQSSSDVRILPASTVKPVRSLTLADGTIVRLHGNSELTNISFTKNTREVFLSGEGYFDVQHDNDRPFIVHTTYYQVVVLGTAFNVNAKEKNNFSITVAQGRVRVEETKTKRIIGVVAPNQLLTIDHTDLKSTPLITKVNAQSLTKWAGIDLLFNDTDWQSAACEIERYYGVKVKFKNEKILHCRFTGDFSENPLNQCLDIICALTNSKWQKEGVNTIWIAGKGCD